jgi:hypothetical protein
MIDIGGKNLPKTISTHLGAKLAKIYKKKGIEDVKKAIKKSLKVLKGHPKIKERDEDTLEVTIKYKRNFCPIGGKPDPNNPEKAEKVQKSICIPYTYGFHNEFDSNFKYKYIPKECILSSGENICRYILERTKRENRSEGS